MKGLLEICRFAAIDITYPSVSFIRHLDKEANERADLARNIIGFATWANGIASKNMTSRAAQKLRVDGLARVPGAPS